MPCYDDEERIDLKAYIDKLTRMLDVACYLIESGCSNGEDIEGELGAYGELGAWWHAHQRRRDALQRQSEPVSVIPEDVLQRHIEETTYVYEGVRYPRQA